MLASLWRKAGLKEKSPQSLESTAGSGLHGDEGVVEMLAEGGAWRAVVVVVEAGLRTMA